jgi:hypothetical protein
MMRWFWEEDKNAALILAVRHQREAGYWKNTMIEPFNVQIRHCIPAMAEHVNIVTTRISGSYS